jgi:alcohol dehydrogenase
MVHCPLSIVDSTATAARPFYSLVISSMRGSPGSSKVPDVLSHSRTRVVFGRGRLSDLGTLVRDEGGARVLLVTDPGIVRAGHVDRAVESLKGAGIAVTVFDAVAENPTTEHVEAGVEVARQQQVNFLVGLGGGSAMDCAKGINFILTNGGQMQDYWGVGKALRPMLPMIAVPTTAGTGSEAQSFALITDPVTHQKMACGDVKAACRWAILDPQLTRTCPQRVAAAAGIDAVAHAVETAGTTKRNAVSLQMSREAWTRLSRSFERVMRDTNDDDARADMLLGAHLAGAAIEQSMLGAAHACANPLTARFGIVHGVAVGLMLPHVIRFNCEDDATPYVALGLSDEALAMRVEQFLDAARLPRRLADCGVTAESLPELAEEAAKQWTASFNPRQVGKPELLEIYWRAI